MREFRSTSLADQVFDKLENDIILGVYPRGDLLTELKLVEQLGVSRTPIREALRRLEQERLIEDSGKGSVVLGITQDDLLDIMNIRQHIEGLAAAYAAKNLSIADKEELKHIMDLQDFYFSKHDAEHLRQVDEQFHDLISTLSGRAVIKDTLVPLHRKTRRYRKASIEDEVRTAYMVEEHKAITEAILSGNAEKAEMLMSIHICNAKLNMLKGSEANG